MSKVGFVAFFYLAGLGGIVLGSIDAYFHLEFSFAAAEGIMSTSDPNVARVAKNVPGQSMVAEVIYTTRSGIVRVPNKRLGAADVQRLARGETIPVRFLRRDPDRALFDGNDPPPLHFAWLVGGGIALAVATFAHRLLRREAGVS